MQQYSSLNSTLLGQVTSLPTYYQITMKLSSGLVTLLAGLAAGNPAMLRKRQADQGAKKALETYCGNAGFEAGDVLEADEKLQGTCRKKDGPKKDGPSVAAATIFCDSVGREFNGAGGPYMKADYVVSRNPYSGKLLVHVGHSVSTN